MSRQRKTTPAKAKAKPREQQPPRQSTPQELAREAIAHEESAPGNKVRMTFRVTLDRRAAEALAERAIREAKNIGVLVGEILEGAATKPAGPGPK